MFPCALKLLLLYYSNVSESLPLAIFKSECLGEKCSRRKGLQELEFSAVICSQFHLEQEFETTLCCMWLI